VSSRCHLSDDEIQLGLSGRWADQCPPIASPAQLAELFGFSIATIYEWLAKGRFDGAYRKRGRHVRVWRDRAIKILFGGPDWRNDK
jgi:hypothetical protein